MKNMTYQIHHKETKKEEGRKEELKEEEVLGFFYLFINNIF